MSSQEEKDKIAERIIEREKKKHTIEGWFEEHKILGYKILVVGCCILVVISMIITVMQYGI